MVAIPFEEDDFYNQYGLDRSGYYYLTTTRTELATALEDHPKINDENVYSDLINFLQFDFAIFNHTNLHWQEIFQEYDEGFVEGDEKDTCTATYTDCVHIIAFAPGDSEQKGCINTVVTYSWECPGGGGGYIPGGGSGGSGGSTSSGGGGKQQ